MLAALHATRRFPCVPQLMQSAEEGVGLDGRQQAWHT